MVRVEPLSGAEDDLWRALMRIMLSLPRHLDRDLMLAVGVNSNEYLTLMSLSEAPNRELRMTDLARSTYLSASRTTRVVDQLQARGLATKRASAKDGRGNVAALTSAGLAKVEASRWVYLARMRALVLDHIDRATAKDASQALLQIADRLRGGS
jgi:DNA-binding MarR family transcriptional regulator